MDALKSIIHNVPLWLDRIENISADMAVRQRQLAVEYEVYCDALPPPPLDQEDSALVSADPPSVPHHSPATAAGPISSANPIAPPKGSLPPSQATLTTASLAPHAIGGKNGLPPRAPVVSPSLDFPPAPACLESSPLEALVSASIMPTSSATPLISVTSPNQLDGDISPPFDIHMTTNTLIDSGDPVGLSRARDDPDAHGHCGIPGASEATGILEALMPTDTFAARDILMASDASIGPGTTQIPAASATPDTVAAAKNSMQLHSLSGQPGKRKLRPSSNTSAIQDGKSSIRVRRHAPTVYYDGQMQAFFEDLVKFISSCRNMMRKAKMAAKIAQIKKLAESDLNFDDDCSSSVVAAARLATIRGAGRVRRMAPFIADGQSNEQPSQGPTHDQSIVLDEHLDSVQISSEKAAHHFLCNGECDDLLTAIYKSLEASKALAQGEIESDQTATASQDGHHSQAESTNPRTARVISMRRDARDRESAVSIAKRTDHPQSAYTPSGSHHDVAALIAAGANDDSVGFAPTIIAVANEKIGAGGRDGAAIPNADAVIAAASHRAAVGTAILRAASGNCSSITHVHDEAIGLD